MLSWTLDYTILCPAQERDGYPADIECLFMTDGASPGVHRIIQLLTRSEADSFLTPVPQYPLYSASLALYGTSLTPYYLDESINWGLNLEHLQEQYDKVRCMSLRAPVTAAVLHHFLLAASTAAEPATGQQGRCIMTCIGAACRPQPAVLSAVCLFAGILLASCSGVVHLSLFGESNLQQDVQYAHRLSSSET